MNRAERDRLREAMVRLADGDRSAFSLIFAVLRPLFSRFAARSLPAEDAEDVAQTALLKLFAGASEFDAARGDALSWALGIVAWEVRTKRTRVLRRREVLARTDDANDDANALTMLADGGANPEEALIAADLEQLARELVEDALAPGDVATIRAALEGQRPAGLRAATFRKRLERALSRLRAAWKERHDPG